MTIITGNLSECLSINGYFAQYLRFAQKLILGISTICLWLFFLHASILNKISHFWIDTSEALSKYLFLIFFRIFDVSKLGIE